MPAENKKPGCAETETRSRATGEINRANISSGQAQFKGRIAAMHKDNGGKDLQKTLNDDGLPILSDEVFAKRKAEALRALPSPEVLLDSTAAAAHQPRLRLNQGTFRGTAIALPKLVQRKYLKILLDRRSEWRTQVPPRQGRVIRHEPPKQNPRCAGGASWGHGIVKLSSN